MAPKPTLSTSTCSSPKFQNDRQGYRPSRSALGPLAGGCGGNDEAESISTSAGVGTRHQYRRYGAGLRLRPLRRRSSARQSPRANCGRASSSPPKAGLEWEGGRVHPQCRPPASCRRSMTPCWTWPPRSPAASRASMITTVLSIRRLRAGVDACAGRRRRRCRGALGLETGKLAHRFLGHEAKIVGLAVSADGRWAASASWDRTARLWDLPAQARPRAVGTPGGVNSGGILGRRTALQCQHDGTIGLWAVADGHGLPEAAPSPGWASMCRPLPAVSVSCSAGSTALVIVTEKRAQPSWSSATSAGAGAGGLEKLRHRHGRRRRGGVIRVLRSADALPSRIPQPLWAVWALPSHRRHSPLYGGLTTLPRYGHRPPRALRGHRQPSPPVRCATRSRGRSPRGRAVRPKCSVCHTLHRTPQPRRSNAAQVFGRRIGTLPGIPIPRR